MYELVVLTNECEFKNTWSTLTKALEGMELIMQCDNVLIIDCVDMETGEILMTMRDSKVVYESSETPLILAKEMSR